MSYMEIRAIFDICNRPDLETLDYLESLVWENADRLSGKKIIKLLGILDRSL